MPNKHRASRVSLQVLLLVAINLGAFWPAQTGMAQPAPAANKQSVVISEFRTRGPNGTDDEFIELFNADSSSIEIIGWKLKKSSGCGGTLADLWVIANVTLDPGQYYLIAKSGSYSGSATPDASYTAAGVSDDGGLALLNLSNEVVDQVGLCATTTYKEGTALTAFSATINQSYERKISGSAGSCRDTDNNNLDFVLNPSTSNPQNFNSAVVPCLLVTSVSSPLGSTTYTDTSAAVIDIQLTFSNVVTVTGAPTLLMETGVTDRSAVYVSGSGSNILTFHYSIQPGDNTNDLDYASVNALSLNGGSISGASGNATLLLPQPGAGGSLSLSGELQIDNTSSTPQLLSFTYLQPASQYTNADQLVFRATFNEAVENVDVADFTLNTTSTATVTTVSRAENGRMYDITIAGGDLSNYNGDVSLDLAATADILDIGNNPLPVVQPATDQIYILDNTRPTVTINQASGQADLTGTLPINFTVQFTEAIDPATFTAADITQAGTSTGVAWSLTTTDNITFTLSAIAAGNGTLIPVLNAGSDTAIVVKDLAGNPNEASTSSDNSVTFSDTTPPAVTINQASGQADPTGTLPINFTVQFSEPINPATFTSTDIVNTGTAASVSWVVINTGNNQTFTLAASATSYGTIIPSMAINRVLDLSGFNNTASTSSDNTVTYAQLPTATPVPPAILINEIAWAGTSSSLSGDEWIELYNPGSTAVLLNGWRLQAADGSPDITLSGTIAAGGYFLLERDDDSTVSDIPADQIYTGELENGGEELFLLTPSNIIVDSANKNGGGWPGGSTSTYGTMERIGITIESDSSWRTTSGTKKNGKTASGGEVLGTPKQSNTPDATPTPTRTPSPTPTATFAPTVVPPRPIINEVLARPNYDWNQDGRTDVFDEFIEIKNLTVASISLENWKINTLTGASFTFPTITLKPGEHIVYYASQTNLLLSDGGATLRLVNPSGKIYDAFTYPLASAQDRSFCRLPDGTPGETWYEDCLPTPYLPNTREGQSPTTPGNEYSHTCNLPDTLPQEFLLAECNSYGANIWNPQYWSQQIHSFLKQIFHQTESTNHYIE